jgi:hypothetical protein
MTVRRLPHRLGIVVVAFTAIGAMFVFVVRPWYLRWGATDDEVRQTLPGDEIVPGGVGQETRAITIHASAERVWPWVAQIGQDRGGFYSYDLLENLVGCEMPTVDLLRLDRQSWQLGDKLWMYPPTKAGVPGAAERRADHSSAWRLTAPSSSRCTS